MSVILTVIEAAAGPVGVGATIGAAAAWDHLREPHRPARRPFAVVDRRTYRQAVRRIERLVASGDPHDLVAARHGATAVCVWLRSERNMAGRAARRVALASTLERWELRRDQILPLT